MTVDRLTHTRLCRSARIQRDAELHADAVGVRVRIDGVVQGTKRGRSGRVSVGVGTGLASDEVDGGAVAALGDTDAFTSHIR